MVIMVKSKFWYPNYRILLKHIAIFLFTYTIIFYRIYHIPSSSMENTLLQDDYILVRKIYCDKNKTKLISRNDLVVFQKCTLDSISSHKFIVKRCVGIPRDEITLEGDRVLINNLDPLLNVFHRNLYQIELEDKSSFYEFYNFDLLGQITYYDLQKKRVFCKLTNEELESLIQTRGVRLAKRVNSYLPNDFINYLKSSCLSEIYIPKHGDPIVISQNNCDLYRKFIPIMEKTKVEAIDRLTKQDSCFRYLYSACSSFFFMLGDNPSESIDSRSWGLIPVQSVIGVVALAYRSSEDSKQKFNPSEKGNLMAWRVRSMGSRFIFKKNWTSPIS